VTCQQFPLSCKLSLPCSAPSFVVTPQMRNHRKPRIVSMRLSSGAPAERDALRVFLLALLCGFLCTLR
jgi:hypothetical protein